MYTATMSGRLQTKYSFICAFEYNATVDENEIEKFF